MRETDMSGEEKLEENCDVYMCKQGEEREERERAREEFQVLLWNTL